jgi:DNA invertase Pin-like site-specific DNA recombinase
MLIGYARVPTEEQTAAGQVEALTKAGCERIFTDEGVSGAAVLKPELARALDFARPGDVLAIWRLDRLGRSLRDLIDTAQLLDQRHIGFRSLREAIDTTTASGRLYFHLMGAFAEFERDVIRERTVAGLLAARAGGKRLGRPPTISDEQWAVIKRQLKMTPPTPVSDLAALVGASRQAIYRRLKVEEADD